MNLKYQIFVSSTYEDLKDERNEIIKACLNMGYIPVGMEMFSAADEEQWQVITRTIDQCDYYVVILAHRYGSTVDGISYTEKEYDYAVAQGVPVLGFVIDDKAPWPSDRIDRDPKAAAVMEAFKSKVQQKLVRFWQNASDLQAHFAVSLGREINVRPRRGWVRAPEAGSTDIAQTLSDLTEENARLRREVETFRSNIRTVDDLDSLAQYLSKQTLVLPSRGDEEPFCLFGDVAFTKISPALAGIPGGSERIARQLEKALGCDKIDLKALKVFLEMITVCGLCSTKVSQMGLLYEVTDLGKRMYVRLANEALEQNDIDND